jgi:hypothetical protein
MDQQQRDRLDQDNPQDRSTDTTRSQNQQRSEEANSTNVAAGSGAQDTGSRPSDSTRDNAFSSGTTSQTSIGGDANTPTGSHAEGQYPKQDQGGATGGQTAQQNQGGAAPGQVGKPGDQPE